MLALPDSPSTTRRERGFKVLRDTNTVSFVDTLPNMLDCAGLPLDLRTKEPFPARLGQSMLPTLDRSDVALRSEWPLISCPTRVIRTRKCKGRPIANVAWRLDFYSPSTCIPSRPPSACRRRSSISQRSLRDYNSTSRASVRVKRCTSRELRNLTAEPRGGPGTPGYDERAARATANGRPLVLQGRTVRPSKAWRSGWTRM